VREEHRPETCRAVALEQGPAVGKMSLEGDHQLIGEGHDAVLAAFSIPHDDGSMIEVEIFDPQANTLQEP
jgi:hypothetical protein